MRKRTTARLRVAVALVASTALVAGCGSSGGSTGNSDDGNSSMSKSEIYQTGIVGPEQTGSPKDGGTLVVGAYAEARSLDPTKTIPNGLAGGTALANVYGVLMRYDTSSGEFEPQLAKSLTSNADHTKWTLQLRPGVKFSDGEPLNAAAVMGSIGYYMKNKGFYTLSMYQNLKKMVPQGENTLVFELKAPWPGFPDLLAGGFGMITAPAAYKDGPKKFKPIGAGPFMLDTYKPGESLTLKPNPTYYGDKPHLDQVKFVWLSSDRARLDALKSGQIDVAVMRNPEAVVAARKAGYPGAMLTLGLGSIVEINSRKGRPGSSLLIRRAINAALDPKTYNERIHNGAGLPTRDILAKTSPAYTGIETAGHDLDLAKKLVAQAKKKGLRTSLTLIGQADQQSQNASVTLSAMLEQAGFKVKRESLTNIADQLQRIYVTHDFDIVTAALSLNPESPYITLSSALGSKSPQNPTGYANPKMDKLLAALQAAEPGDQRKQALTAIDKLWQKTIPSTVLGAGADFMPWNKDVHGIVPTAQTMLLFGKAWKG